MSKTHRQNDRKQNGEPQSSSESSKEMKSCSTGDPACKPANWSPLSYLCMDTEGRILKVNQVWRDSFGYSSEEVVGSDFSHLLAPESKKYYREWLSQLMLNGELSLDECAVLHKNGSQVFVAMYCFLQQDDEAKLSVIHCLLCDITRQKQMEKALKESELKYRQAVDSASDIIFTCDMKGNFILVNPAGCAISGYPLEDFQRMNYLDVVAADHRSRVQKHYFRQFLKRQASSYIEFPIVTRQGKTVWLGQSANLKMVEGEPAGFHAVSRDITERILVERALRDSETRLRTIFETVSDGIFLIDLDGKCLDVNPAGCRIFGCEREEILNSDINLLLYSENADAALSIAELSSSDEKTLSDQSLRKKDGSEIWVEMTITPIRLEDRDLRLGIMCDITERKRSEHQRRELEARIQQSQKYESLAVLAGGTAHYFNNLLTSVIGNASMALMEMSPSSPERESVESIERVAKNAAALTSQILAYSGRGRFVVKPVNLSQFLKETTQLIKIALSEKVSVNYNLADMIPNIEADPSQIRQLIVNLTTNSNEAIDEAGGSVNISTGSMYCGRDYLKKTYIYEDQPEGQYVYLEISDTGCGMDGDTLKKLFDPFFSTKFTGRGLGMAAVLGIVRGHNGAILTESEPGRGTTVRVLFPAVTESVQVRRDTTPDDERLKGKETILVVEEEEGVRNLLERSLSRFGYMVVMVKNGMQGVKTLEENPGRIDAVLLDLNLPVMNTSEYIEKMRSLNPEVKIILTSRYSRELAVEQFEGLRLDGFIQKPYTPMIVLEKVREALGG